MKAGAENRKKTITLGILGAVAFCGILYNAFALFGGETSTPPAAIAPLSSAPTPASRSAASSTGVPRSLTGAIPGVAAQKLASTAASLDPTLDQAAMLRTEGLVYSGSGRNIFSATYVTPVAAIPHDVPSARPNAHAAPPPPAYIGPPPPPPIPLRFFGTAQRTGATRQAFLLSGDDVYLAGPGDIVAKRFKVGQISNFGVQVTDLTSNNTQTLPLQQQ